jgi:CDGSH-type Zn-finger protein
VHLGVVADARARVCAWARVALLIQHATGMRHIVCGRCGSTSFCDMSHERHDFREKVTVHKMCLLTFSTTFI